MSVLEDERRSVQEHLMFLFDGCSEWTVTDWANVTIFAAKHSELDDEGYMGLVVAMAKSPLLTMDEETDLFFPKEPEE